MIRPVVHTARMDRSREGQHDPVPEAIGLAERWRVAGKILAVRSPEVFAEMLAFFAQWADTMAEIADRGIIQIYRET